MRPSVTSCSPMFPAVWPRLCSIWPHVSRSRLRETCGQIEQSLGHTAGNIGEHEVTDGLIGPAQTLSQGLEEVHGRLGAYVEPGRQVFVLERSEEGRV